MKVSLYQVQQHASHSNFHMVIIAIIQCIMAVYTVHSLSHCVCACHLVCGWLTLLTPWLVPFIYCSTCCALYTGNAVSLLSFVKGSNRVVNWNGEVDHATNPSTGSSMQLSIRTLPLSQRSVWVSLVSYTLRNTSRSINVDVMAMMKALEITQSLVTKLSKKNHAPTMRGNQL